MKSLNHPGNVVLSILVFAVSLGQPLRAQQTAPIIPNEITASTIPANGDVNPWGVAFVPGNFVTTGMLQPGDLLVSNFNNKANLLGTGSSIVRVTPSGSTSLFYQASAGTKLGTGSAVSYMSKGVAIVGYLPTTDGSGATAKSGGLLLLNSNGKLLANLTDKLINGPLGLAVYEDPKSNGTKASFFISNVLSGNIVRFVIQLTLAGTVTVVSKTQIGTGYTHRLDPAALAVGPNGLTYDPVTDKLYVAATGDNAIYAIPNALTRKDDAVKMGTLIYKDTLHLHGPLGLVLAPNGHLLTINGDLLNIDPLHHNEMTEFSVDGKFVAAFPITTGGPGAGYGLALSVDATGEVLVAAVDDDANTVHIYHLRGK